MKIMVYPRPRGFLMPSNLFFFFVGPTILKIKLTIFIQQKLCKRFFSFVEITFVSHQDGLDSLFILYFKHLVC